MRIEVDTVAVEGVADAVRRAAARVGAVDLPDVPSCEDVAAADAVRALLTVSGELIGSCRRTLDSVAALVDTAAVDYARTEARAAARQRSAGVSG